MRVDVVDEDEHLLADQAVPMRPLVAAARGAHHDRVGAVAHLRMRDDPVRPHVAHLLAEAERHGQEVQGADDVFVQEVRNDPAHVP